MQSHKFWQKLVHICDISRIYTVDESSNLISPPGWLYASFRLPFLRTNRWMVPNQIMTEMSRGLDA
jgi:hypothetical protein